MKELTLIILFISVMTGVSWASDITLTPKQFYSLAGRQQCWDAYDAGYHCDIVDGDRIFKLQRELTDRGCEPMHLTMVNPTADNKIRIKFMICIEEK